MTPLTTPSVRRAAMRNLRWQVPLLGLALAAGLTAGAALFGVYLMFAGGTPDYANRDLPAVPGDLPVHDRVEAPTPDFRADLNAPSAAPRQQPGSPVTRAPLAVGIPH